VKHERETGLKQFMSANDTAEFLEGLARKIQKLVANFKVRMMNTLPLRCIDELSLRSSTAYSELSRRSKAYSDL
jgi:hypothetical protein